MKKTPYYNFKKVVSFEKSGLLPVNIFKRM